MTTIWHAIYGFMSRCEKWDAACNTCDETMERSPEGYANEWQGERNVMVKTHIYVISRCSKLTDMIILIICYLYLCLILCALQVFIPKSHRSCSPLHSLFGL